MTYVLDSKVICDIVTLSEAKSFLRVDFNEDDVLIQAFINAAVSIAEKAMNRDIITTTWINYRDSFCWEDMTLRRGAFQSLESIEYLVDGSYVVLNPTEYTSSIGGSFGQICEVFPPSLTSECNLVKITFKTGFGDDETTIPEDIKVGINMDISFMYSNRGDCDCGGSTKGLTLASKMIYKNYKIMDIVGLDSLG